MVSPVIARPESDVQAFCILISIQMASPPRTAFFVSTGLEKAAGVRPFGGDFLRANRLRSPSAVQRVVKSLLEPDIIDRDNGSFVISDRFFRLWIRGLGELS